ncbi:MAG: hypothetical protein WB707_00820 [Candidatus Acidiferrales bacterium]
MFAQERQLRLAVNTGAPNQIRNRKRKVLMDGLRLRHVANAEPSAAQAQSEIGVFRDAKMRIERPNS